MTKEQFKQLPEETRRKIGKNYARYRQIINIQKAFDTLFLAAYDSEFQNLIPADLQTLTASHEKFKTHLASHCKTFHVCTDCYPMFRKRKPSTKQSKNLVDTCAICNQRIIHSLNKYLYKIRTPFTLLEAQQYAHTEYPENFV